MSEICRSTALTNEENLLKSDYYLNKNFLENRTAAEERMKMAGAGNWLDLSVASFIVFEFSKEILIGFLRQVGSEMIGIVRTPSEKTTTLRTREGREKLFTINYRWADQKMIRDLERGEIWILHERMKDDFCLDMSFSPISDTLLRQLNGMPHLRVLKISGCWGVRRDAVQMFILQNRQCRVIHTPVTYYALKWIFLLALLGFIAFYYIKNPSAAGSDNSFMELIGGWCWELLGFPAG